MSRPKALECQPNASWSERRGGTLTMSERIMGAEAHWLMGRVMPREFLEEVGKYLHHVAPERDDELMAAVKARAEEIAEATKDLAVDGRSEGPLAICAVVLVSYETLLPLSTGMSAGRSSTSSTRWAQCCGARTTSCSRRSTSARIPPIRSKRRAARRSGSTPPTSSLTSSDRVQGSLK